MPTSEAIDTQLLNPGLLLVRVVLGLITGGLLFAFGFLGPVGPALMLSVMLSVMRVAIITVHRKNKFFVATNGIEHPLMFATVAVGIAFTGPGSYSLDAALGKTWLEAPTITWIMLIVGFVGGLLNLALRRQTPVIKSV
jgi:uncharacterized membrane protein YphA (DoxX/SURF4 family)